MKGLPALEPVDEAGGVGTADVIHHGAVGRDAVPVEFLFGHAGALHQAHNVLVLLGGDASVSGTLTIWGLTRGHILKIKF